MGGPPSVRRGARLPSGAGPWVLEGNENCLAKGKGGQREGGWWTQGRPLLWGGLSWEKV